MTKQQKEQQTAARRAVLDRLAETMQAAGWADVAFELMEPERRPDYVVIYPNASRIHSIEACIEDNSLMQMVRDVMEAMP